MDEESIVDKILKELQDSSLELVLQDLQKPFGKHSSFEPLNDMVVWFQRLSDEEKKLARKLIRMTIHATLHRFCMVVDQGDIELSEDDFKLLLVYESEEKQTILAGHEEKGVSLFGVLNSEPDFPDWILNDK